MTSHFDYVQARLQARHGGRPAEERWRLLESTTDLGGYLQQARNTGLAPWVQVLTPQMDVHPIEQSLRRQWRAYSVEVAGWVPQAWRPAVLWTGSLPDLPFVAHLARGGQVQPWMLLDPVLAPLALEDPQRRQESLAASALAGVADAVARKLPPMAAWLEAWEATWPPAAESAVLDHLKNLAGDHLESVQAERSVPVGEPRHHAHLVRRLTVIFRRETTRIGAVFAHLGLVSLDVERLRRGLVLRALFPDMRERPRWA